MNIQGLFRKMRAYGLVGFVWVAGLGFSIPAFGQRYLEDAIPYQTSARIRTAEGFVEANFTRRSYLGKAQPQDVYYSYYRDSIYATQGGYHGRPLHGVYTERYDDNTLKVLGKYHYGLKKGKWQHWDRSGVLRKVSRWKEGKETGRFAIYGESGKLQQRGYFVGGKFDGVVTTYHSADSTGVEKRRYQNGVEIDPPNGGNWFGRTYDRVRAFFW